MLVIPLQITGMFLRPLRDLKFTRINLKFCTVSVARVQVPRVYIERDGSKPSLQAVRSVLKSPVRLELS